MRVLKRSTARTIAVFLADSSDHITGKTGATLTVTASKAGAAFASISPTVTELSNGWYSVALTTSHTDTFGDLAIHATASGADPIDLLCQVVAYDPFDSVRIGITALPNASPGSANGLLQMGSGSSGAVNVLGGVVSSVVAADGIGSLSISSGAYDAIADRVLDYALTNGASGGLGAAILLLIDGSGRVKLRPDGLDDVSTSAPSGVASNFREMMVQGWRRWFKKSTLDASNFKTYADNGTTVLTTQAASDDGTTQSLGAAT